MTRAEIDYWHILAGLFVFDEKTKRFMPADEFPTCGRFVVDYHKVFYRRYDGVNGDIYVEDRTAYKKLRVLADKIAVEYHYYEDFD